MQSPQTHLIQIRRILALWPPQAGDSGEELLRSYVLATQDYDAADIEAAVDNLVKGIAPGVSPSFRPKPPEVGAECRRCMNLRLDAESRRYAPRGSLPPPTIAPPDDAARARVAAKLREGIAALSQAMLTEDAEAERRRQEHRSKLFARFDPQTEREAIKRLGYSTGDSDAEGDMGERAA